MVMPRGPTTPRVAASRHGSQLHRSMYRRERYMRASELGRDPCYSLLPSWRTSVPRLGAPSSARSSRRPSWPCSRSRSWRGSPAGTGEGPSKGSGAPRRSRSASRGCPDWHAPIGGVLLLVCGAVALAGFPLDDVWHTLFGQDVTLWGPTHIQMIGGASLATLAMWVLIEEGRREREGRAKGAFLRWVVDHQTVLLGGAFLLGLSTLQGEFDFGVPQFRQLYHPVMIVLAASIALVAVRIRGGRGSALGAVLFFVAVRGVLSLVIGPI